MSDLGLMSVVIGAVIILSRGPLILAPHRTLIFYERFFLKARAIRLTGLLVGMLGTRTVLVSWGVDGPAADLLALLGWLMAGTALWLLLRPNSYRRVVYAWLEISRDGVDPMILRGIGLFAVSFGSFLIHLGFRVL
jgi:hypothetical protein